MHAAQLIGRVAVRGPVALLRSAASSLPCAAMSMTESAKRPSCRFRLALTTWWLGAGATFKATHGPASRSGSSTRGQNRAAALTLLALAP